MTDLKLTHCFIRKMKKKKKNPQKIQQNCSFLKVGSVKVLKVPETFVLMSSEKAQSACKKVLKYNCHLHLGTAQLTRLRQTLEKQHECNKHFSAH